MSSYTSISKMHSNIFELLEYLFVIITILQCNSVFFYMKSTPIPNIIELSWPVLLFLMVVILFIKTSKIESKTISSFYYFILYFSFYIFIILLINMINYHFSLPLFKYFTEAILAAILLYMLFLCGNLNSLFYKFENIVLVISVISIVFWILSLFNFPTNVNVVTSGDGYLRNGVEDISQTIPGYFYIHFLAQGRVGFLGISIIRNTGIFFEAPTYSSVLVIALLVELFLRNNNRIITYKTTILLITILSTTSTNGLIIAICSVTYCEIMKLINKKNYRYSIYYLYIIPFILIFSIILFYLLVSNKANGNILLSSFNIRMNDFSSTLATWKSHLIIGSGFGNNRSIIEHMASWRFMDGGTTNVSIGLTNILANGGIILGAFYIMPVILSHFVSYKIFGLSIFSFVLLILEGVEFFYIFIMLIMYLWIRIVLNNKRSSY